MIRAGFCQMASSSFVVVEIFSVLIIACKTENDEFVVKAITINAGINFSTWHCYTCCVHGAACVS